MNEGEIKQTLIDMASETADEYQLDPTIEVFKERANAVFVLKVHQHITHLDPESKPKNGFQVNVDAMTIAREDDWEEVAKIEIERKMQWLRDSASIQMDVNGHRLQFYLEKGFYANCMDTGEEWSILPEEVEHTPPTHMLGEEEPYQPEDARVFADSGEIPGHLKEKMMMYVIGWAVEYTPYEWMSKFPMTNDDVSP